HLHVHEPDVDAVGHAGAPALGQERPQLLDAAELVSNPLEAAHAHHYRPGAAGASPARAARGTGRSEEVRAGQRRTGKSRWSTRSPAITTSGSSSRCCPDTEPKKRFPDPSPPAAAGASRRPRAGRRPAAPR